MATLKVVGTSEVAALLGVHAVTVSKWTRGVNSFPAPDAQLASGPVWRRSTIDRWAVKTGRRKPCQVCGVAVYSGRASDPAIPDRYCRTHEGRSEG